MLKPTSNGNGRHKATALNRHLANRAIHRRTDLISGAKDVLLIIADKAGHGSSSCTASYDTLAIMTGKKRRWAICLVQRLAQSDWITIERRRCPQRGDLSNHIRMGPKFAEAVDQQMRMEREEAEKKRPNLGQVLDRGAFQCTPGVHSSARPGCIPVHPNDSVLTAPSNGKSSSSTPPPAERTTTTTFASLPESGGSKQKAKPLSDDDGREMVHRVASQCPHLPGAAAKFQAAPELPRRCGHDWRGLANQVVRLEEQVAAGDIKFRTIENPVHYVVGMLKKLPSAKLSAAELAGYQATVERLLKPALASPPRPRKDSGPDHAAEIADRERELPDLEAEVANESNPTAKRCKQRALNQAREELAALKTESVHI